MKFYSSGMYVRLGFAVAVNVDPDILVIDEVLAVGDERFQRKCIDRVKQFQEEGRTILLVTHSADTVRSICDRGVVLSHGHLIADAEPGEATRIFRERLMAEGAGMAIVDPALVAVPATPGHGPGRRDLMPATTDRPVRFRSVHRVYSGDNDVAYMTTGDDLTVRVEFEALHPTEDVVFSLEIRDEGGNTLMRTDTSIIGLRIDAPRGTGVMHFGIVEHAVARRLVLVRRGIQSRSGILYDWQENAGKFEVMNPSKVTGRAAHGRARRADLDRERSRHRCTGLSPRRRVMVTGEAMSESDERDEGRGWRRRRTRRPTSSR